MRVNFLGTGTSRGVPVIGCTCDVCNSSDKRNKRLRTSVMLQSGVTVVIDASVDFRTQMLRHQVRHLDAIILTHPHVDHILGLDDVYPLNIWSGKSMPVYANADTLAQVRMTFRYLFEEKNTPASQALIFTQSRGISRLGTYYLSQST